MADSDGLSDYLPGNLQSLSDACLVVDALGPMARKDLLDEFVQLQLLPYEKIFSAGRGYCSVSDCKVILVLCCRDEPLWAGPRRETMGMDQAAHSHGRLQVWIHLSQALATCSALVLVFQ